ncbi:MAG: hypothetical protein DHS20C16_06880 [Phycisphaerae bacterium]|nr:MAG: hypothetical protein DHS20C16_06880 [Phycisphaerae bacterium]
MLRRLKKAHCLCACLMLLSLAFEQGCESGGSDTIPILETWSEYQSGNSGEGFLARNTELAVPSLVQWDVNVGRVGFSSPVIAPDGTIIVGNLSGELVAIRPDGSERWRIEFAYNATIMSTPAIAEDGSIFVVVTRVMDSEPESVLARMSADGATLWVSPAIAPGRITTASPRILGNHVFLYVPAQLAVFDFDGNLVDTGLNIGCELQVCGGSSGFDFAAGLLSTIGGGLLECTLTLPFTASECWDNFTFEFDGSTSLLLPQPDPTAVVFTHDDGGPIIVALSDRCMTGFRFNEPNLEELWQHHVYGGNCDDRPVLHGSPANLGGGLLVIASEKGEVTAYDPLDGTEFWKYETIVEQPPISGGVFGDIPQDPLPGVPFLSTPASFVRPIFIVGSDSVHLLDDNGELMVKRDLLGFTQASFALSGNHAYLGTSAGLFTYDFEMSTSFTVDGEAANFVSTPAVGDDGTVYAVTNRGRLRAYNSTSLSVSTIQFNFQTVDIGEPVEGVALSPGEDIVFSADVSSPSSDGFNGETTFSSDIDGELCSVSGTGPNFSCEAQLTTLGLHVITVAALDVSGTLGTDSVTVEVVEAEVEVNVPPTVEIVAPEDAAVFATNETISLIGVVNDANETIADANITWTSDNDGLLGTGESTTTTLTEGTHVITLAAVDSNGLTGEDSVTIQVVPGMPPTVEIAAPDDGSSFTINETIDFQAEAADPQDGTLSGESLVWDSSIDGALGTGESLSLALSQGLHTITVTATNSLQLSADDSIMVTVIAGPGVPTVTISNPVDNATFGPTQSIDFEGSATDPEDEELPESSFRWLSNHDGEIGTGRSIDTMLSSEPDPCDLRTHTITLEVTDSDGNTTSQEINIKIRIIC